jgi:hypothetical protein
MKDLVAERKRLLEELKHLKVFVKGSYFERFSTCMRKECRCHQGEKHGPRGYITFVLEGVQRQIYIPQNQVEAVKVSIKEYHRLLEIVDRLSEINLEMIRGQKLESRGGRSSR